MQKDGYTQHRDDIPQFVQFTGPPGGGRDNTHSPIRVGHNKPIRDTKKRVHTGRALRIGTQPRHAGIYLCDQPYLTTTAQSRTLMRRISMRSHAFSMAAWAVVAATISGDDTPNCTKHSERRRNRLGEINHMISWKSTGVGGWGGGTVRAFGG